MDPLLSLIRSTCTSHVENFVDHPVPFCSFSFPTFRRPSDSRHHGITPSAKSLIDDASLRCPSGLLPPAPPKNAFEPNCRCCCISSSYLPRRTRAKAHFIVSVSMAGAWKFSELVLLLTLLSLLSSLIIFVDGFSISNHPFPATRSAGFVVSPQRHQKRNHQPSHTQRGRALNMGLLKVGKPKKWEESKKDASYIRKAGVRQFISTYNRVKDLKGDELLWGDEIEYGVFILDEQDKKIRLSLRAKEIMDNLNEKEGTHTHRTEGCNWVPEYGAWMVEATPKRPYTGFTTDLLRVERNMRLRRKRLLTELREDEVAPTFSTFPLLGAMGDDGSVPPTKVGGAVTLSDYIGDGIINPHPRFGTLSANIRQRRGEKVNIRVPLFRDTNTPEYEGFDTHSESDGCCGSNTLQVSMRI